MSVKIYFTYSAFDKNLVTTIKTEMHNFFDIHLDEKESNLGTLSQEELEASIDSSDLRVLFLTKNSIKTKWVRKEIDLSLKREIELGRPFLITIQIGEIGFEVPKSVKNKQYIRLSTLSARDVNYFLKELNDKLLRLVIKYGITKTQDSPIDNFSKNNALINWETVRQKDIFIDTIDSNLEINPQTLLLIVKDEANNLIRDAAEKRKESFSDFKKNVEDEEDSTMTLVGKIGSTVFDIQERISGKILEKIEFIEKNLDHISPEEGLYILKKYIISL